jgi:hypothetical protein
MVCRVYNGRVDAAPAGQDMPQVARNPSAEMIGFPGAVAWSAWSGADDLDVVAGELRVGGEQR